MEHASQFRHPHLPQKYIRKLVFEIQQNFSQAILLFSGFLQIYARNTIKNVA